MRAARPAWTVRPKGERDAAAVAELLAEIAREGGLIATEWPFDLEARAAAMRDALLLRRCVGWVALEGRTLIADLTVTEIEADEPELGMMVEARLRGRGIGRALLRQALAWAHGNGKLALRLRVFPDNVRALALYRSSGFVEVELQSSVIPSRSGAARDALVMRCPTIAGPRDARARGRW